MTLKKEVAACLPEQAAGKNHLQRKTYQKAMPVSRLKLVLGELLLFGNKKRSEFWPLFEALLVQSYQGSSQSPVKGRDTAPGLTISHRPD